MNSGAERALDLTEAYVRDVALPSLEASLPHCMSHVALGLVGNGSECFGYDDAVSRDHDWGVDFFVWVPAGDVAMLGQLADWRAHLLEEHRPMHVREQSAYGARTSVMTVEDFYSSLIGVGACPQTVQQWARIPEENLAMAVNGRVFFDGPGEFTKVRDDLLGYLPEDLRLKRIATACMLAAQAGQYNFSRMARRDDVVTMRLCLQRFIDQVERLAFLLNRTYRPYYKWVFRAMSELPILGGELAGEVKALSLANLGNPAEVDAAQGRIEHMCELIEDELREQNLSECDDSFIQPHGESVFSKIADPVLGKIPITFEM